MTVLAGVPVMRVDPEADRDRASERVNRRASAHRFIAFFWRNRKPDDSFPTSPDLEVLRRFLATIADDFVLDGLPFVESAQSCALNRRNVNEHVLAATLRLNESVALGRVEPLHCSLRHLAVLACCFRNR